MDYRALPAALLIGSFAASAVQAGPSYSVAAAAAPGQGSAYGNFSYTGSNQFSGAINTAAPYGITGTGTPSNPGSTLFEASVYLGVAGGTSFFDIEGGASNGIDFSGQVLFNNVGATGGSLEVVGFFDAAAASYFGVSQYAELSGIATLQLSNPSQAGGTGNKIGSLQFAFAPDGVSVPEPASLLLLATGVLGAAACLRRRTSLPD